MLKTDVRVFKGIPFCTRHGGFDSHIPGTYKLEYNSYYCVKCNRWLQSARTNDRPDKPIKSE